MNLAFVNLPLDRSRLGERAAVALISHDWQHSLEGACLWLDEASVCTISAGVTECWKAAALFGRNTSQHD